VEGKVRLGEKVGLEGKSQSGEVSRTGRVRLGGKDYAKVGLGGKSQAGRENHT
jgi:hypothetical protein